MAKLIELVSRWRGSKRWLSCIVFIGIVVTAGLALPQVLPNATAVGEAAAPAGGAAQDPWNYNAPPLPEAPDARTMLMRLALGTGMVSGLCVGTLWLGKRWLQVKPLPTGGAKQLRLIEALPLQGRCCVYLLQAGSRQVLVGADGGGLRALLPLTDSFEQTLAQAQDGDL
ncbi:MAG TPA: flagellar biosynthetic protein FliO [Gemmataceae bacterium]|nr:flagellar biosynthetic protein FliO [Gemmataceae bacterium]